MKKQTVKAWAVLYHRPVIFGAAFLLMGVYTGAKPTRGQIGKNEVLVPCTLTYELPPTPKAPKGKPW